MSDGWALQAGTSHNLGQNFTRAYGITYSDRDNTLQNPFQTSWGLSTRIIGGLIMAHGDEAGLVLPPKVAPIQVVVVPIARSNDEDAARLVEEACARLEREAGADVRLRVDRRDGMRPGEKFAHWELRGVPLRITVGAKDLADGSVTVVRRLDGEQSLLPLDGLGARLQGMLDEAQTATRARAQRLLDERSVDITTIDELAAAFADRPMFASGPFCNSPECEEAVKGAVHALTVRVLRADRAADGAPCLACARPAEAVALMARAY